MSIQLIKGDCLVEMPKLEAGSIDLVLADVPYGTTRSAWDAVIPFEPMWECLDYVSKKNAAKCIFGAEPFSSSLRMSNIHKFKYDWVWVKNLKTGNLNAKFMPMGGHEYISVFYDAIPTYNPQKRKRTTEQKSGNKKNSKTSVYGSQREDYIDLQSNWINPDTVIDHIKCVHNSSGKLHPNEKPVELMIYFIKTYTNEGDTVLDFTMGSGTTGVACKLLNRKFIGIEKDPEIFQTAWDRIYHGKEKKPKPKKNDQPTLF